MHGDMTYPITLTTGSAPIKNFGHNESLVYNSQNALNEHEKKHRPRPKTGPVMSLYQSGRIRFKSD